MHVPVVSFGGFSNMLWISDVVLESLFADTTEGSCPESESYVSAGLR
jgi:hypothetical protein